MPKYSELNAAGTLAGTEVIAVVQSGSSVRTTATAIANTASALPAHTSQTITPAVDATYDFGSASLRWNAAYIASGGMIDFNGGDVRITHSANALAFTGGGSGYSFDAAVSTTGSLTGTTLIGSVQALTGAGAISTTTLATELTTTGINALTLADGTAGQVKIIVMIADGGDGTLTPTNFGNGTTITFNDVGDAVCLVFVGTDWWIVSNNGCTVA